jgi:predicted nucleotide-binding protein (sugar kinase/HSP70/actin superfamily)
VARVGIPRALSFYQYFPAWKTFFEALGAEVVISPPSNRAIFLAGNSRAVAETCLPVKLFFGHVVSIVDKCDFMFIPALRSLGRKAFHCSKFLGLPDMTRALIRDCVPVLDPEVDLNKGLDGLYREFYELGRYFHCDKKRIRTALEQALEAYSSYRQETAERRITTIEALSRILGNGEKRCARSFGNPVLDVAVIGHQYVIHDDYVNHRLISRLQGMGARVFTPEMAYPEALETALAKVVKAPHWSFEVDIVGAGQYYLETGIDGIISVAVFGCGPDSMMINMIAHRARELKIPFLHLSVDEHTTEGGLIIRLEAFLEMVKRRKKVCV